MNCHVQNVMSYSENNAKILPNAILKFFSTNSLKKCQIWLCITCCAVNINLILCKKIQIQRKLYWMLWKFGQIAKCWEPKPYQPNPLVQVWHQQKYGPSLSVMFSCIFVALNWPLIRDEPSAWIWFVVTDTFCSAHSPPVSLSLCIKLSH